MVLTVQLGKLVSCSTGTVNVGVPVAVRRIEEYVPVICATVYWASKAITVRDVVHMATSISESSMDQGSPVVKCERTAVIYVQWHSHCLASSGANSSEDLCPALCK